MLRRRMAGAVAILALLATVALVRTARVLANRSAGGAAPTGSADLGLLTRDVERLSSERAGDPHELPVEVVCQPRPDPLLRWTLREARHVRFRSGSLDPGSTGPALVVGPDPPTGGEAPCQDPPLRAGARYRAGPASVVVLWVPHEP